MPEEARLLHGWLKDGKPELGWRGDPRLFLHIGVISASKNGIAGDGKWYRKGDIIRIIFEVRRENEDGTETSIVAKKLSQWHEIIPTLIEMDPRTPGFKPVMDRVEAHHEQMQKDIQYKEDQIRGEMMEHLGNIIHQRTEGQSFFSMRETRAKQD